MNQNLFINRISSGGNLGFYTNYYPLHGQIEMLATRAAYCELTTLNTLSNELKGITKVNQFDELGMLKKTQIHEVGINILSNTINYKTRNETKYLSKQVAKEIIQTPRFTAYRDYQTDALGNIISISDSTFGNHTYQYDNRGFLTKEDSTSFEYDGNGNITRIGNKILSYDNIIKDRLEYVDGWIVSYDENNPLNPKSWNDKYFKFEGRRLKEVSWQEDQITYNSLGFQYNDQGLRTKKTLTHTYTDDREPEEEIANYYYDGDKLITEIRLNNRLDFLYDENGLLYGFVYNSTDKYFYVRDTMQNILGIITQSGELVVKYSYSAYGEINPIVDTSNKSIGAINPFRYKGYYYDNESGMYYCKSRFFIPQWCRWLNADSASFLDTESLNEMNLFTYCANNPILGYDPDGNFFFTALLIGATIGLVVGLASQVVSDVVSNVSQKGMNFEKWEFSSWQTYAGAAVGGAIGGALTPFIGPVSTAFVTGFSSSSISMGLSNLSGDSNYSFGDIFATSLLIGSLSGITAGVLDNIKIPKINSGRGSLSSISKQINTKLVKEQIKKVSMKTIGKMATLNAVYSAPFSLFNGIFTNGITIHPKYNF